PPGVPQFHAPAPKPRSPELPPDQPEEAQAPLPVHVPRTALPPPPPFCPTARQGAFPDQAATTDVTTTPALGIYRWKPSPTQIFDADHFPINASQLIYRFVTDVSPVTKSTAVDATGPTPVPVETSTFTYKVSTWRPDGTSSVDTFKVEERATRASASGPNIGPTIRTGDPARGLSLIAHVEHDAA